jgi:CBS domain-containing protein
MTVLPRFNYTIPVLQLLKNQTVHRISPQASARRASIDMIKGRLHSMIVTEDDGKMVGILTERDFLKLPLELGAARGAVVTELMTPAASMTKGKSSFTVRDCVSTMRKAKCRQLPVMEKGEVRAVITMADISQSISDTLKKRDQLDKEVTVGDLIDNDGVVTPKDDASLPHTATVADAVTTMRKTGSGALLVKGDDAAFGLFTERDYVQNVVPYDERSPAEITLAEVARFASGHSKRTMQEIAADSTTAYRHYRPEHITCVERSTRIEECLSLMLGNGLLYAPVTENKKPISVISMRDINLFLAPEGSY